MHFIPDVPKDIQNQIDREILITQKAMWTNKSVNMNELNISKTRSQMLLNIDKLNSETGIRSPGLDRSECIDLTQECDSLLMT